LVCGGAALVVGVVEAAAVVADLVCAVVVAVRLWEGWVSVLACVAMGVLLCVAMGMLPPVLTLPCVAMGVLLLVLAVGVLPVLTLLCVALGVLLLVLAVVLSARLEAV
jgi:hypothetical protein